MSGLLIAFLIVVGIGVVAEWVALHMLLRARPDALLTRNYRGADIIGPEVFKHSRPYLLG